MPDRNSQHKQWAPIRGIDLRPGMQIRREPNLGTSQETVGPYRGECDQGVHFGSGCFSRISTWWIRAGT